MNFIASHIVSAAMTRTAPSLAVALSPAAERPGISPPARAQNSILPPPTGSPGASTASQPNIGLAPVIDRRSGETFWSASVEQRVARARENPERGKLYAFYAAGAAFAEGVPAEPCPFDRPCEAALRESWFWFYRIQADVARRARPAQLPAEFKKAERRVHHSKRVTTTSAAYAEQLGIEAAEGEQ